MVLGENMGGILGGGGGGGGGNTQALLLAQALQQQQLQQANTNAEGQQLALLSKQQAQADNTTASLSKFGLGRAMLTSSKRATLGG
jgi:hypothetical protein